MILKKGTSKEILMLLFRSPSNKHTISSLTEELKRSRVGIWKTIKNLEKEGYVNLFPIELLRRKVYTVEINFENPLVEKSIGIYLMEEALAHEEWADSFNNLGHVLDFLVLSKGETTDSLIGVTQKGKFIRLQKPAILKEKKGKEINISSVTNLEFLQGLKNQKKEYVTATKNGIILFGQENFIRFLKQAHNSSIRL